VIFVDRASSNILDFNFYWDKQLGVRLEVTCLESFLSARRFLGRPKTYKTIRSFSFPRRKWVDAGYNLDAQAPFSRLTTINKFDTFLKAPWKLTATGKSPLS